MTWHADRMFLGNHDPVWFASVARDDEFDAWSYSAWGCGRQCSGDSYETEQAAQRAAEVSLEFLKSLQKKADAAEQEIQHDGK